MDDGRVQLKKTLQITNRIDVVSFREKKITNFKCN